MCGKNCLWTLVVLLCIMTLPPAIQAGNIGARHKAEQQLHSLFLINGQLPHLMKPIRAHWDDPALDLTDAQKDRLTAVQNQSMTAVQQLQKQLPPLVDQVKTGMMAGRTPEELAPLVDRIAALKTRGTMVHLNCLHRVRKILNREQLNKVRQLANR